MISGKHEDIRPEILALIVQQWPYLPYHMHLLPPISLIFFSFPPFPCCAFCFQYAGYSISHLVRVLLRLA